MSPTIFPPYLISANILICEKVLKEHDQVFSAIRIIDVFQVQVPDAGQASQVNAQAIVSIKTQPEHKHSLKVNLRLIDARGNAKSLFDKDVEVSPVSKYKDAPGGVTMQVRFRLEISLPGIHYLAVDVDGRQVASTPITLLQAPIPEPTLP